MNERKVAVGLRVTLERPVDGQILVEIAPELAAVLVVPRRRRLSKFERGLVKAMEDAYPELRAERRRRGL